MKDGKGTLERIVYDAKDRVVEREDALGQKSFAAYDENGNLIETIDEAGNKTSIRMMCIVSRPWRMR